MLGASDGAGDGDEEPVRAVWAGEGERLEGFMGEEGLSADEVLDTAVSPTRIL